MNRERAKALLPIIQAFAEGRDVQFQMVPSMEWEDAYPGMMSANFSEINGPINWRIKPEPTRTKPNLKTFTLADIRKWKPCYDPAKYAPENWRGAALNVLRANQIPAEDRLWVVLREEVIDVRTARLFGCWCAREALKLIPEKEVDLRSITAIEVSERYANGEATDKELAAARDAAWDAQINHLIKMLEE